MKPEVGNPLMRQYTHAWRFTHRVSRKECRQGRSLYSHTGNRVGTDLSRLVTRPTLCYFRHTIEHGVAVHHKRTPLQSQYRKRHQTSTPVDHISLRYLWLCWFNRPNHEVSIIVAI